MKRPIVVSLFLAATAAAAPPLLPFQGHLTTAAGAAIDGEARVVQFKIYDAPVSGNAVWAGEVHKLSVNKGLVNTILGTKTAFPETYSEGSKVMFSEPLYVEITVDADASQSITAADPPLLPRQVLLPANFAQVAHSVWATDGSEIIKENGEIDGQKMKEGSIALSSLGDAATPTGGLSSNQISDNAIRTEDVLDGEIKTADLGGKQVTLEKMANNSVGVAQLTQALLDRIEALELNQAYSAVISPDGTVISQNGDWIKSVVTELPPAHGNYRITFKDALFAKVPAVVFTGDHVAGVSHVYCDYDGVTTDGVSVYLRNQNVRVAANFTIFASRQK